MERFIRKILGSQIIPKDFRESNDSILKYNFLFLEYLKIENDLIFEHVGMERSDCWHYVSIQWNFDLHFCMFEDDTKNTFGRRFFMEVIAVVIWTIWKQRNGCIFRNVVPSFTYWRFCFNDPLKLLIFRFSPPFKLDVF